MDGDTGSALSRNPSGQQFELGHGDQRATVVEVGGGIREYRIGDREILESYAASAMCDAAHGAQLIPWPNRIGDGRYTFGGEEHQLALTEPARGNAMHGLVRWQRWEAVSHRSDAAVVRTRIHPQPGYPFDLDVEIAYRLGPDGLAVDTTATNAGEDPCPFGVGAHPYLSPGTGLIDEATVQLGAATRVVSDPERLLPVGEEPVEGTPYDLRSPRRVADLELDTAYTDLERDPDGRARVRLTGVDGRTVELWVDSEHPVIQLFTGDTLGPDRRRRGLAAEPMTCPANAFRTGRHLRVIGPGDAVTSSWGVRLVEAPDPGPA